MNPIYNRDERRLRSFPRVLVQFGLFRFVIGGLTYGLPLALLVIVLLTAGQVTFSTLSNGDVLRDILNQSANAFPLTATLLKIIGILVLIGAYWLFARFLDRRSMREYGLNLNAAWWRDFAFGAVLGGVLMAVIFGAEYLLGWIKIDGLYKNNMPEMPFWARLVNGLFYYLMVAVSEELLARGYLMKNLSEGMRRFWSPRAAVVAAFIISSSLFGLLHLDNPNATIASTLNLILLGVMLGMGYFLTGEIALPIGLHLTWNFFQGMVFGFPVSGGASYLSVINISQLGPEVWTGGAFGPEGGWIGVLVGLLGIAFAWGWIRLTRGKAQVHEDLAVFTPRAAEPRITLKEASQPG